MAEGRGSRRARPGRTPQGRKVTTPAGTQVEERADDGVDSRWWAHILPAAIERGGVVFGYWDSRPSYIVEESNAHLIYIVGEENEPVMILNREEVLSIYLSQSKHATASPQQMPPETEQPE